MALGLHMLSIVYRLRKYVENENYNDNESDNADVFVHTCLEQISSIVVENGCSPSVDLFPIIGRNMMVFPLLTLLLLFPMLMLLSLLLLSLLLSLLLLLFELELEPRLAASEREEARKFKKVKVETAPPVSQAGSPSTFLKSFLMECR